jgi:hypothetical protein
MVLDGNAGEAKQLFREAQVPVARLEGQGEEGRIGPGLGLRGKDAAGGETRLPSGAAAVEDQATRSPFRES